MDQRSTSLESHLNEAETENNALFHGHEAFSNKHNLNVKIINKINNIGDFPHKAKYLLSNGIGTRIRRKE
jgi:hypothetical protein